MSKRCAVAVCKCQKTKNNFEIRIEKKTQEINNQITQILEATWAYKIRSDANFLSADSSRQELKGIILFSDSYPGCPYCGQKNVCLCGECNRLSCMDENQSVVVCPWDNKKLRINSKIEGITGGGDR